METGRHLPPFFLLTGPPQGGKTTALKSVLADPLLSALQIDGFIAEGLFTGGVRTGFDLLEITTGRRTPLSRSHHVPGGVSWMHFHFLPGGITAGNAILERTAASPPDLTVVDEVGPFELQGGGWAPSLDLISRGEPRPLLWVVRSSIVERVVQKWGLHNPRIFEAPLQDAAAFAEDISGAVTTWKEDWDSPGQQGDHCMQRAGKGAMNTVTRSGQAKNREGQAQR